jgi:hypothetical protein
MAFCGFLKQSTAVDVLLGPFVDETDGKTAEVGLTITQPDVQLSKNGAAQAQKSAAQTLTHDAGGCYPANLSTTDTGTLGLLTVRVHESGALPIRQDYLVVPANVWDSLHSTDLLQVDVQQVANDAKGAYIVSGTAVAIADGSITLASGQGTTLSGVKSLLIVLTGGTSAIGKSRYISHDTGDVFLVDPAWNSAETTPSGTITYVVLAAPPSPTSTVPAVNTTKIAGTAVDTAQAQIGVNVVAATAAGGDDIADRVLTVALTESYAADAAAPTLTQAVLAIQQFLQEKSISGTTMTVKKLDGTTTAMTLTLSDATTPTSVTRAT